MMRFRLLAFWFVVMSLPASPAAAREGVITARDRCLVQIGPYLMSYNGYQPQSQSSGPFCVDLPAAAHTLIILDVEQKSGAMDQASDYYNELRDMAIDFRIIRNSGHDDEENIEKSTEAYLPPRKYPSGTLQLDHTFTKTGEFIGLISAKDDHGRVFVSRFPFMVGPKFAALPFAATGLVLVGAAAAGFFFVRRRSASQENKRVPRI
jgi:hypothetical protein